MMDIELTEKGFSLIPSENGMLLADVIKDRYPNIIVIFFSQYLQYQKELLRHEPFGFVEKPLEEKELVEIVEKAILRLRRRERNETTYQIKSVQGIVYHIKLKDILYIESQRPRVKVISFGDELQTRKRLDEVEGEIKELSPDFIRVNKSFLVNCRHVREYSSKIVVMMNGTEISIGRKYREDFKEKMSN